MSLAIFDLDNTLINGDSDFLWGEFLAEIGVVDTDDYKLKNQYFYNQYNAGKLDIAEFLAFSLAPLAKFSITQLNIWHKQFMVNKIQPILLKKAQEVVNWHKKRGDTLLVISATNDFVITPIVKKYGINNIIATKAQIINNRYNGKFSGVPCFRDGKVTNLKNWLLDNPHSLDGSYFYSDSHNDIPLLQLVDNPIAINADKLLINYANSKKWQLDNWLDN